MPRYPVPASLEEALAGLADYAALVRERKAERLRREAEAPGPHAEDLQCAAPETPEKRQVAA